MRKLILIGLNTLQGFANPAFNFLILVFGIKQFGKEHWGNFINIMLWVFLYGFVLGWGNRDYLLRTFSKTPSKMYSAFYSNLFSRSILIPFAFLLFLFFDKKIALFSILLIILMFFYNSLSTLVVYHQKFKAQLITETIGFAIIFGSIFYINVFKLILFLKIYTLVFFVKLIVLSFQLELWKQRVKISISVNEFKHGLPFFILGLSGWLMAKIDIYLVDFYLDNTKLSEYQLLITAFLMLQALAAHITIPFTKHLYRLPKTTIKKIKKKLYFIAVPITVFGGGCIWLVMSFFVKLNFSITYYIIGVLMALPCFFYIINIIDLFKRHKENTIIFISLFAGIINIVLILILIKPYDVLGVLISVCITQWIALGFYKAHWFLKKQTIV